MKLDRETEALLYWASSAIATPLWTLSPDAAREEYRRTLSKTEIAPPAIGEVGDLAVPGPAGPLRLRKGQIRVDGQCILKQDAASFCGPGYRLQGNKCVQGYVAPKPQKVLPSWQLNAIKKGCPPGMDWNAQEGCHEND